MTFVPIGPMCHQFSSYFVDQVKFTKSNATCVRLWKGKSCTGPIYTVDEGQGTKVNTPYAYSQVRSVSDCSYGGSDGLFNIKLLFKIINSYNFYL